MNELSSIKPSDHQPALFLTQEGIPLPVDSPDFVSGIVRIPSFIRNSMPFEKSLSLIFSSDHHLALFLIHCGIKNSIDFVCSEDVGTRINSIFFVFSFCLE